MLEKIFKSLNDHQKDALRFHFENESTWIIKFEDGSFIGVNVNESQTFKILEKRGSYSYGKYE